MNDIVDGESEVWTILRVLEWTRRWFEKKGIETARLDAEVLLAHALSQPRVMLYARHDQPLTHPELARIRAMVSRRGRGEPVAYLTGSREFWSLSLKVDSRVLIPRPDTERLVEVALDRVLAIHEPRVLDVGTGSGAIALAIAWERRDAVVTASDVSPDALAVAQENVNACGEDRQVDFVQSDLCDGLGQRGPFHLIAANLPYITDNEFGELMPDVRDFEPRLALCGGSDGLDVIRRLVAQAPGWLKPGGWLVLESSSEQTTSVALLLEEAGFDDVKREKDAAGHWRVVVGKWRGSGDSKAR